jgi:ketosteroid isomerase-like protein
LHYNKTQLSFEAKNILSYIFVLPKCHNKNSITGTLKQIKMKNSASTKQLLETYYKGFSQKQGWESVISDDFKFIGGNMTEMTPVLGKPAYIEIIKRFSRVYKTMRIKEMIVEDERACVIGNYDYLFPNGKSINGDVAEIWKAKDGKLDSLTIFFDTLTFQANSK